MYAVSNDYIEKLTARSVKTRRIVGTVGNVAFTENDILSGSFTYSEQAVSSNDIKLGGVFIGQLNITFLRAFSSRITRGTWKGKAITISVGLKLDNGNWEDVPLKTYYIEEASHGAVGVTIKAYDIMSKFDKAIGMTTTSGTMYDMLHVACETCEVPLGMTRQQIEALPNGNVVLGIYPTNDIDTWRDLVSWIAVTAGGFATINRSGGLEIRSWSSEPVLTVDKNTRFSGGSWSDFETYYTGVSVVNIEEATTSYYGTSIGDTGLTMNLGSNPLLQYGTEAIRTAQRRAVLDALSNFRYTPYKCTSLIDPALDLGDVIRFTEGLAGTESFGCVMKIDFNYAKGTTIQGYGKNPAIFGAQSKTDKNMAGLISRTTDGEYVSLTYVNVAEVTLGEDEQKPVIEYRFASIKNKTVALFHEINLDVTATEGSDGIITCQVEYYLNEELIDYSPVATWNNDGKHILSLMYFLTPLAGGTANDWEVRLTLHGATGTIAIGSARAMIQGQGIVQEKEWEGQIEIEEQIPLYTINGLGALAIAASTTQRVIAVTSSSSEEQVEQLEINAMSIEDIRDTIYLSMSIPDFWRRAGEGMYAGSDDGLTIGLL